MNKDTMKFWNQLANVPPEHLKSFQKGGGFKGTDIKPQWRYQRMTEVFGPCGHGWGMDRPNFQVVGNNVYCTVGVWWRDGSEPSELVYGVGGETLTGKGDDEAFKKAYTDALGNALVKVGVASDVYMGWFDGSKYVKRTDAVDEDAPAETGASERKSAYAARKDGAFERVKDGIAQIEREGTIEDLKLFWKKNWDAISAMPQGWQDILTEMKDEVKAEFEKGLSVPMSQEP